MTHRDDHGSFGSFMAGFILGGAIGAGLALVLAPQSGQSIRRTIRDQAVEARGSLTGLFDDISELIARMSTAVPAVGDKESTVRRRIDELRQQLEQLQSSPSKA